MFFNLLAAASLITQVASPERQKELLAEIHAKQQAQRQVESIDNLPAYDLMLWQAKNLADLTGFDSYTNYASNILSGGLLLADIKLATPEVIDRNEPPTYYQSPRPRPRAGARYKAYNAKVRAEQEAQAKAQLEYQQRMAPIWAEQQQRAAELHLRRYELELRHRDNLDFNDAIRGVTRPR